MAERRIDLRPPFEPIPIKIDIGKIEPDPKIFEIPSSCISKMARDFSQQFEAELLRFADRFKTRRVYIVNWSIDERFK